MYRFAITVPLVVAWRMLILPPTGPHWYLAADATIEVQGVNGKRRIKSTDFFTGLFSTALEDKEIITAIRIPVPPEGTKASYQKFSQPASRFAIAGCAVMRFPDGKTNIAFAGVSENAFRDVNAENEVSGKPLNDDSISAAVNASVSNVTVMGDHFASEEYRKHLGKGLFEESIGSSDVNWLAVYIKNTIACW